MAYEHRRVGRQKILYNSTNDEWPLVYQLVVDGEKVTPTSATIAIYKPGSTTAVLAAVAMTVATTRLTYNVVTTTIANYPVDTGFRADVVVTYNAQTWPRTIIFDVVKYLLDLGIGFDQLLALDDGIRGMEHDGDEDFSPLIDACRDDLQAMIETKVVSDNALVENMILDNSRVASAARLYILGRIWQNKGNTDKAARYREDFALIWPAILSSIKYDTGQGGDEPGTADGLHDVRLVT